MATIKFPSEMPSASDVGGNDKLMISKDGSGEAFQVSFSNVKQYLDITDIELDPVQGGATEAEATVIPNGPSGQNRKMDASPGWYSVGGGAPVEATAGHVWKWFWNGTSWSLVDMGELPMMSADGIVEEGETRATSGETVYESLAPIRATILQSEQLFDKETAIIEVGSLLASTGGLSASNHNLRARFPNTVLQVGETYSIKRSVDAGHPQGNVTFFNASNGVISFIPTTLENLNETTFTVPVGTSHTYIVLGFLPNVNTLPLRDNPVVNGLMLVEGAAPKPYEPFGRYTVKPEAIPEYNEVLEETNKLKPVSDDLVTLVNKEILVIEPKKNLLNVAEIDFSKRYSPGDLNITSSENTTYIGTPYIKVKGGEFYTFNAGSFLGGGYFENIGDTNAVEGITTGRPVDNIGFLFQVPMEYDGYYVVLNLVRTDTTGTTFVMDYQLEHGEQATEYEPYVEVEQFNPDYLISSGGGTPAPAPTGSLLSKLTDVNSVTKVTHGKIEQFFRLHRAKTKDVVIVNSGTSLFARSSEHCTLHPKANERPPLFHSMNAATHIWDAIKWDSQFYRRYDYPSFFTETGSFASTSNLPEWDDNIYRSGSTRYSNDSSASVSFVIPINAWQFNFIYRTDSQGTEGATISIAQGNGQVEVFNGTAWVEANGFSFSQLQSETFLNDVIIPDARTGAEQTVTSYKIGGNTTYQKRLKMRCKSGAIDSRGIEKEVTISKSSTGRFMYWGVEWSVREFMITMINASRGSHNITLVGANSSNSLSHYQDNEVWGFEPDLILTENPIHNSGAASAPNTNYPTNYWGEATNDFFFDDNPVSMKSRATAHGLNPEWLIFTSSIAWNFGGINDDGTLKIGTDKDGEAYTALESFSMAHQYLIDNHPNVLAINSVNYWVKSGFDVHGDLRAATEGSGKAGLTFTNEGSHWNDTGSKIIAKSIVPYLNFE